MRKAESAVKLLRTGLLLVAVTFLVLPQVDHAQNGAAKGQPTEIIQVPIADGPVSPTWQSLGDHFKTPTWWRHAKIGMWLHWGPQSVPQAGDWYAKWMYMPRYAWPPVGSTVYQSHLAAYGHPSVAGYKDILPLWKAEHWQPNELMKLYRRAGARYVIAQGMHHDNFDLWDSKYQPWNSVAIGPHRSILAGWKAAAQAQGMRFGIAFHGDYALWWYQPAFLSDLDGPLAGVPYDAAQSYPGNDTWWQKKGLKLKDLYGIDLKNEAVLPAVWPPADVVDKTPLPSDPALALTAYRMSEPLKQGVPNGDLKHHRDFAVEFSTKWTNRVIDAINQFDPDFIYFDGGAGSYPFCGFGTGRGLRSDATPRVIADLYNRSMAEHGGRLEAMAFTKGNEDPRAVAVNVESNVPAEIKRDQPWQTENGMGEWFYRKGTFYESGMVLHEMLEAVSRDGNYAINIPLTPSGELDPGGRKVLKDMGNWMDVNGEGIYDSNAWDVWGEGAVVMKRGNLGPEQASTPYTAQDIRYTVKGSRLYAFLMAWPAQGTSPQVTLRRLALSAGTVSRVDLLGGAQRLKFVQTDQGLVVTLPGRKRGSYAWGLRIVGDHLHAAPPKTTVTPATS
jgi:alpha-L-fucosidase